MVGARCNVAVLPGMAGTWKKGTDKWAQAQRERGRQVGCAQKNSPDLK
jgi:hypothetical protein